MAVYLFKIFLIMGINYIDYLDEDLNYDWLDEPIHVPKKIYVTCKTPLKGKYSLLLCIINLFTIMHNSYTIIFLK